MKGKQLTSLDQIKKWGDNANLKDRLEKTLEKEAGAFITSVINISSGSQALQKCEPSSIWAAAMKAASLKLPIEPSLGYAYIIPYGKSANFQLGYKGIIQLAIRSGQYKRIHVTEIYDDELDSYNPVEGILKLKADTKNYKDRYDAKKKPIGYYAKFSLVTGFEAEDFMTFADVDAHAKKFSQAYKANRKDSPWFNDFDKMAKKTVLKRLLSTFGILSIEMRTAVVADSEEIKPVEEVEDTPEFIEAEVVKEKVKKITKVKEEEPIVDNEPDEEGLPFGND